jgi:hypothetical protein
VTDPVRLAGASGRLIYPCADGLAASIDRRSAVTNEGGDRVSARLDWATAGIKAAGRVAENVVAAVDDLAYTVNLASGFRPG